jgi:hypothetical protein
MKDTVLWYSIAKPNPTVEDAQTQAGVHLEEVNEMLIDGLGFDQLTTVAIELRDWSSRFKKNLDSGFIDDINRVELLDSICDQIVTGTALAKALGMDIIGAFAEVEASNLSKFVYVCITDISDLEWMAFDAHSRKIESEGRYSGVHWKRVNDYVVWYDQSGKILKGPNYFEPNLEEFV